MSEPSKVGEIVVWQNCTGKYAYLNGTETQITGGLAERLGGELGWVICYRTNTIGYHGTPLLALPFELRRRKPPTTGEQSVLAMFNGQPQAVPA